MVRQEKRKNYIIEDNFRIWINEGNRFVDWLQNGSIDYWDFNSCIWIKPGDYSYIAVLEKDVDYFIDLGYEVIDIYKNFALLRK
jgi:hypothetical protein